MWTEWYNGMQYDIHWYFVFTAFVWGSFEYFNVWNENLLHFIVTVLTVFMCNIVNICRIIYITAHNIHIGRKPAYVHFW